jgi:hypothetical protein
LGVLLLTGPFASSKKKEFTASLRARKPPATSPHARHNLPPIPGAFPDYCALIARDAQDGVRELVIARWGMRNAYHKHQKPWGIGVTGWTAPRTA